MAKRFGWDDVKKLLINQRTTAEICAELGISKDAIQKRCQKDYGTSFGKWSDIFKAENNIKLREDRAKSTGGPAAVIDWNEVERLLMERTPKTEIAATIGVSRACLEERALVDQGMKWAQYAGKFKAKVNIKLRTAQNLMALTVPTVNIHQGKQYLDQADKQELKISVQDIVQAIMTDSNISNLDENELEQLESLLAKLFGSREEGAGEA